jgi:hypothetical protein
VAEDPDDENAGGSYQRAERISSATDRKIRKRTLLFLTLSLVLVIALGLLGSTLFFRSHGANDPLKIQGKVALSEQELRDVVKSKHLMVYWAGAVTGDQYALVAPKAGVTFVRYLPGGRGLKDTGSTFRIIATYVQKDAFSMTEVAGAHAGNVGFTNADGNAVFYVKARPTNVYMAIESKDIQIEIFDPGIDQALAIALFHGQIRQIN